MPSTLSEIRTALGQTLSQNGLTVYPLAEDVVSTPAIVIVPTAKNGATYGTAMAMGGDEYRFDVMVLMACAAGVENAQNILDSYVTARGANSIREFLFGNSHLGLEDVDAMVESMQGYGGSPQVAGIKMVGAILKVVVVVD